MSLDDTIREIASRSPRPASVKAVYGKWVPFAWQVRALVEQKQWTISDAVREVVAQQRLHPPDTAFKGIRAAYYEIKNREWPVAD